MNSVLTYVKGFIALFLVLSILVQMVPRENFKKYIRFFTEMVLAFGLLYPQLTWIGKSDQFLETIQYEAFMQQLEEISMDAREITMIDNGRQVQKMENALELDVTELVEEYGFEVKEITVNMSDTYEIEKINLKIADTSQNNIVIGKVILNSTEETQDDSAYRKLKQKMISYYQLSEEQIAIIYE